MYVTELLSRRHVAHLDALDRSGSSSERWHDGKNESLIAGLADLEQVGNYGAVSRRLRARYCGLYLSLCPNWEANMMALFAMCLV